MTRLWATHRGAAPGAIALAGLGVIHLPAMRGPLPFAGGPAEQPAWLMDAFAVMDAAAADLKRREPEGS